jgi:LPXTG-site transpeptidase (sortase) family protein
MSSKRVLSRKFLLGFLIVLGLITALTGGYLYFAGKAKSTAPVKEEPKKEISLHSKPNAVRLMISGVKIDLPVTEGKIVDGVWETTQDGVSHLDISANPGENGNIVIYGHNKRVLFGSLPYVSMGAKIKVVTEDGNEFDYKVYERKNVAATDVSIAYATPSEVLTLYTCDGPLDGKRFVLLAKPVVN